MDLGAVGSSLISLESGNMRCCSHFMDIRTLIKNTQDLPIFMISFSWLQHLLITCVEAQRTFLRSREVLGQPRVCCVVAWSMKLRLWWPLNHRFFADNLLSPLCILMGLVVALMISNIVVCWMHLPKVFFALFTSELHILFNWLVQSLPLPCCRKACTLPPAKARDEEVLGHRQYTASCEFMTHWSKHDYEPLELWTCGTCVYCIYIYHISYVVES